MHIRLPPRGLVVLIGASGSGKSAFARSHFRPTQIVSSDACRAAVADDENDQAATCNAFDLLHYVVRKRLMSGRLTVVDATNVQPASRRQLIELARRYNVPAAAVIFDLPEDTCLQHNRLRTGRHVEADVVRHHVRQLRDSIGGLPEEGFSAVFRLTTPADVEAAVVELAGQPEGIAPPTSKPGEHVIAEGRHLRFIDRDGWEFVRRKNVSGIIGIVPVTDEGRLVLIEQFRPPVGCRLIELPAGLVGDVEGRESESLETAANRELTEETGYQAAHWRRLADGAPSAGVSGERMVLFLATGLTKVGPGGGDRTEDIRVHEVPLQEVADWLTWQKQRGVEVDLKVYAGLFFATQLRGERR